VSLALLLLLATAACSSSAEASKTKTWTLYHRILTPAAAASANTAVNEWSVRGTIELAVHDDDVDAAADTAADDEDVTIKVENTAAALTEQLAQSLTSASSVSYYQLKLVEVTQQQQNNNNNNNNNNHQVLTSVPACNVRRANFRDEFVLQLQPGTARALSLSYLPLVSPLAPPTCDAYQGKLPETTLQFESKVSWETAVPGMVVGKPAAPAVQHQSTTTDPTAKVGKIKPPPGLKWIPGKRKSTTTTATAAGSNGNPLLDETETPPEEAGMFGFFKRYWYIFLPMMIINLMGAAAPAAEEGGGGAGGAGAAVATAGGAAATAGAAAAAGSPVRQRRGKRD